MIDALIQSAVLFAVVAIVTQLLKRRASASLRHMFWALAIIGALAAPLVARVSPLEFRVMPATPAATPTVPATSMPTDAGISTKSEDRVADSAGVNNLAPAATEESKRPARRIAWTMIIAIAWGVGALVLLVRMALGLITVNGIARRAVEVSDPMWHADIDRCIALSSVRQPVDVRMSDETPVPYTCGLTHPIIVLPQSAGEWSAERRDAVLLHELAHISRGDLVMNILSHLTRALYWPNPLAWLAANGLRYEGERAADDAVLRAGAKASDYADHLLDIVKSAGQPVPKIALAMARSSDFEGRLLAILEPGVPRTRMSRTRMAGVAALFVVALVPLTAMTTAAAPVVAAPAVAAPTLLSDEISDAAKLPPVRVEQTSAPSPTASPSPVEVASSKPMNRAPLPQATSMIIALAEALDDSEYEVRLAAVNSLGGLQDPAAITALAKALKEDTDARVREAAAWALGEIDDNRAVPHLLDALKTERSPKVRVKILESLNQIDDPSAIGGVSGALKDPSAEVRRAAVEALGEFGDAAVIPALASMIRDEDVQVRRNVAEALGSLEETSTIDALKEMTRDRDAEVRASAIEGLAQHESMSLLPIFVAALKDSSAHVREHAADALGSFDELKDAPRALIDALSDPSRDVRRTAASALGNIGDEAAVPALKKLVTDTDTETRRHAVEALKDIGGAEAVTALMGLLKDPDPEVRKSAAEALGRKRP
jgi:HEAT repeat protein/beta-lactamase regulating signal transducer with metallopeptidase domain